MDMRQYANAIASIESAGSGDYSAVGPQTAKGNRAYGRYQVMDFNVGPWTEKHFGTRLSPEEFLANPKAQEAVFSGEFGQYVRKYGNPQDAASMWFTGKPMSQGAGRSDILGTTGSGYVNKFNAALGVGGNMQPNNMAPMMDKEEDKTDFRDIAGNLAIAFNSLRHRPDPNVAATVQNIQQQRTAKAAKNKSIEMLRGAGRDDIANAIESGALGAKEGVSLMFREAAELRKRQAGMADAMTLAEFEAGLKVPTVSAGEQKIARLMETGIPRETAIAIADGRITSSRDPQTGRVVLLDKGTGQVIGQAPEGSEQVIVEQSQPSDMFEGLDIRKGTGARGWVNKYINLVSDAIFGGQYASEAGEVREAMNVLGLETLALADTSFAGKPTNFLRERVEEAIVIKPAEISTGPDRAQKKAEAAIGLLKRSLEGAQRALESETSTLEERKSAAAAIPQIESLLLNYDSLNNALSSELNPPSSPAVDPTNIDLMNSLLQPE